MTGKALPHLEGGLSRTDGTQVPGFGRKSRRVSASSLRHGARQNSSMALAMGKVEKCPFDSSEVRSLKVKVVADLEQEFLGLGRQEGDRGDVPIDFRFLLLLLRAAEDPEVGLGQVRTRSTSGSRDENATPPSALQTEQKVEDCISDGPQNLSRRRGRNGGGTTQPYSHWPRKCMMFWTIKRGEECSSDCQRQRQERGILLVVTSLGANRKDRPNGEVTARVLHDVTNGLAVNTRTRLRDQSDVQPPQTSRGAADVKEAHRQIPIDPLDWHLLGCQMECGADVFINTVGDIRNHICVILLGPELPQHLAG